MGTERGAGGRGKGRGEGEGVASPFQRPTPLVIRFSEPGKTFHGDENKPDPITQVNMILQTEFIIVRDSWLATSILIQVNFSDN